MTPVQALVITIFRHRKALADVAFWTAGLLIYAVALVGVLILIGHGSDPRCDPPRHWVAIQCSKGCIYDCR